MANQIRINKYLAVLGICSRRKADQMIKQGIIRINGEIAQLGSVINSEKDQISIKNKIINKESESKVYYLLNKPKGVVCTVKDPHGRLTVVDLLRNVKERVYPVGRLDIDSHGLILLTNDGELANRITHPKFHIPKTYLVTVLGKVSNYQLEKLRLGVELSDGTTQPAEVKIVEKENQQTRLEVVLHEGRNRQIRRMCAALNLQILDLQRVAIGKIKLDNIKSGRYLEIQKTELMKSPDSSS